MELDAYDTKQVGSTGWSEMKQWMSSEQSIDQGSDGITVPVQVALKLLHP